MTWVSILFFRDRFSIDGGSGHERERTQKTEKVASELKRSVTSFVQCQPCLLRSTAPCAVYRGEMGRSQQKLLRNGTK